MASSGSILGNSVLRLEDPTLLTGEGKYVDDLVEPGMLHVSFVRSGMAHGKLVSVDISNAENLPGVRAIYHAGNAMGLGSMNGFRTTTADCLPVGVSTSSSVPNSVSSIGSIA